MKLMLFLVSTVLLLEAAVVAASVSIVVVPEDHRTSLGNTLLLPCVAFGSSNDTAAAISIEWRRNGESLDADPLHMVHTPPVGTLQSGDTVHKSFLEICEVVVSANYSCLVVNGQGVIDQADFRVIVEAPVHLVVAPADMTVDLNETDTHTVVALCAALGTVRPEITWELNGRPISTNSNHQKIKETTKKTRSGDDLVVSTLEICPFRSERGGEYKCIAQTQYSQVQASFRVNTPFAVKPPISAVQNVTVGKESVLSCDFHGYPPPTSFGWTFNGQPADSTPFILQQTQDIGSSGEYVTTSHLNMEVHSVLFQGIYTCMAVGNSSLTKEFQYQVNTQVPAEILIAPPSRAITTSSVTVTCAAYGTPPPKVTWHYNNAIVSGGVIETRQQEVKGVYVVTSFLQLCQEGAEVIDSGQYSCQVGNDVADTQPIARTFDLCFVGDFGFLVTPVSRTSVLKDAVYYLPCVAFSRSGQEINITWSSDGSEIPSDDVFVSEKSITRDGVYVLSSVLEIKCPTFEDELSVHTYTCSATDGMESDSASTDLQLQFIPDTTTTTTTTTTSRIIVVETGGVANKAVGYASYTGSVLCILPLLAVAVMHLASKHLRSMLETIPILNFCIATSCLYVLYIPSSSGPFSGAICALLSSLFHLTFLLASFTLSALVVLRLLKNCSGVKLIYFIAMLLNWGLPVLIWVICIAINQDDYNINASESMCVPSSWSLWLGMLLPFAASHAMSWIALLLTPVILNLKTCSNDSDSESSSRCDKGAFAIGFMLFLFELAWVFQIVVLSSTSPSTMLSIAMQTGFIVSSACLGIVTLLSSFFMLPSLKKAPFSNIKTSPEDTLRRLPMSIDCKPTDLDHELALVAASNPIIDQSLDESGVMDKQIDL